MEIESIDFNSIDARDLSAFICQRLMDKGIHVVLTGGACVTIFSRNIYVSRDLDFVPDDIENMQRVSQALEEIGFMKKGRHFIRKDCPFLIEFVNPPLAIGGEKVKNINTIKTKYGKLNILSPTDCVKDRLAAYFHWNDRQSLEQAILVTKTQKIDQKEVRSWAKNENMLDKYSDYIARVS